MNENETLVECRRVLDCTSWRSIARFFASRADADSAHKRRLIYRGTGIIDMLCIFHREKRPSLRMWPESGRFCCFGCGREGDKLSFVRYALEGADAETILRYVRQIPSAPLVGQLELFGSGVVEI